MKRKIAIILIGAFLLSACTMLDYYTEPQGTAVETTPPPVYNNEPVETTESASDVASPKELGNVKVTLSEGNVKNYEVYDNSVIAYDENGREIYLSNNVWATEKFLGDLVSENKDELTGDINTSSEALGFLDNVAFDSAYEITEMYCERVYGNVPDDISYWYNIKAFAKLNVLESSDERFPVGENLYEINGGDASSYVGGFRLAGQSYAEAEETQLGAMCYNYTRDFGFVDVKDLDVNSEFFLGDCIAWNSDTNTEFNYETGITEDDLSVYIFKSLGIEVSGWSGYANYDSYKADVFRPIARGRCWYYALTDSVSDSEVQLTYYADSAYLTKAKTISYTYEKNVDGTYKITAAKEIADYGYELSMGST